MLAGRRLAISTLHSAADAAAGGTGGAVLLAGEAGLGKTALASGAVAYAKDRGATAVRGTCWEGDGAPGFWPWIQVVRALTQEKGADANPGEAGEAMLAGLTGAAEERSARRCTRASPRVTYSGKRWRRDCPCRGSRDSAASRSPICARR